MLPKSQRRTYVDFDKESKSLEYYNADTRSILTLRNFRFLSQATLFHWRNSLSNMALRFKGSAALRVRGSQRMAPAVPPHQGHWIQEREKPREPRKTRDICVDYNYRNDPFSDEKEVGMLLIAKETAFTVIPGDDCKSLKEAKESPGWPEWEHAIQIEPE